MMSSTNHIRHRYRSFLFGCFLVFSCFAQRPELDSLLIQLKQHPEADSVRTDIVFKIAEAYSWVDHDSMFYYCDLLLKEAKQSNSPEQTALANIMMGKYWSTEQPDKALDYYEQAYQFFKQKDDKEVLIRVNNHLAVTYFYMGNYEQQLFYLKRALQELMNIDNKELEVTVLHNIAGAYFYLENYDLAEEYSLMALQEAQKSNQKILDPILVTQAGIEFEKGNYEKSVKISGQVLKSAREKGQKRLEMVCLSNMAECYIKLGQYRKARQFLDESHIKADPRKYPADYYKSLQLLVSLDTLEGKFKQAFLTQREIGSYDSEKNSTEQMRNSAERIVQIELQDIRTQLSSVESLYEEGTSQVAEMNFIVILFVLLAIGGVVLHFWARHSLGKLNQERDLLMAAQKQIDEKVGRLSVNHQEQVQKVESHQEKYDMLELSDLSKTQLFKTISQDLQAPLVQLRQNLAELMNSDVEERQFRQATDELTAMVGDISLLLENLLQWSKFQSQKILAKPQYIELIALIDEAITQQKYGASEKNITLSNNLDHRLYVYADEEMVRCLIKTILQNTIKLAGANSHISVYGEKNETQGQLCFKFQGKMEMKEMNLQLFRSDHYDSDQSELGKAINLGWMLCRMLLEVNKGNIRIDDVGKDAFDIYLFLPLEEAKSKIETAK